ncbi:hypothetical protein OG429_03085 [Streptomyces sp. NBC_00190]|nr:hypothetical protein [Streptomyces sp. NBC_00190]WSZ38393.1 hypothetical protein OG239_06095 [Streptomyces sp. NBC_00868]
MAVRSRPAVPAAAGKAIVLAGTGPAAAESFPNQDRTGPELRDHR